MPTRNQQKKPASVPSSPLSKLSEDNRFLLDLLNEKFDSLIEMLTERDNRIDSLERKITTLEDHVLTLRGRLDDLESENRANTVILSGNKVPNEVANENVVEVARLVLKNELKNEILSSKIVTGYRIGKKNNVSEKRRILIKFNNRDDKQDFFSACKVAKPENLYVNENLIPARAHILFLLRRAKRNFPEKIGSCGSTNGRVYVCPKTSGNMRGNKMYISTVNELDKWRERVCGAALSDLPVTVGTDI